jgi:hypothetical protein
VDRSYYAIFHIDAYTELETKRDGQSEIPTRGFNTMTRENESQSPPPSGEEKPSSNSSKDGPVIWESTQRKPGESVREWARRMTNQVIEGLKGDRP